MNYIENLKQSEEFEYWIGASKDEIAFAEKEIGLRFPMEYKLFLQQCGMCNYGDVNILGIAKDTDNISYPVIEVTKQLREEINLSENLIVLSYDIGEYLILFKASESEELKDSIIYGAAIQYDSFEKMSIGKIEKLFNSFREYFEDFIKLGV